MSRTTHVSRVLREASLFLVVEAAVQAAFIVYFAILAARFSVEEVGWYALMRRALALAAPLLTLGMMEGLAKFLAIYSSAPDRRQLMSVTAVLVTANCALLVAAAGIMPSAFASIVFGSKQWTELVLPFAIFAAGVVTHMYTYACLRGTLQIGLLSALQFLNLALLPIAIVFIAGDASFGTLIAATGISLGVCSGIFLAYAQWRRRADPLETMPKPLIVSLKTSNFLHFSLTRVPALLLAAGLTSLVPVMAQYNISSQDVGFLSIAVTLLIGVAGTIAPLGTVLLPHISAAWAQKEAGRVSSGIHLLIGASIQLFVFMTAHLILFADVIIEYWMGAAYVSGAATARVVLLGAIGLGFYTATRAVLDAVSDKPINTVIGAIALSVVASLAALIPGMPNWVDHSLLYAACVAIGCSVLGIGAYVALRRRFSEGAKSDLRHLVWAVAGTSTTLVVAGFVQAIAWHPVPGFVMAEGLAVLIYFGILWFARFEWLRLVAERLAAVRL